VDVGSIEQVIINMIVNARDAMPNGGRLRLETRDVYVNNTQSFVSMSVADNGTGMTPEVRARLFEPFFTTKGPGHGTGLGLAMCHGIVEQAGGQISVMSEPGVGTCFSIQLPRLLDAPVIVPENKELAPRPKRGGDETVLLVEDEAMILRVAKTALERQGYRVLCAGNGVEALELARATTSRIDLLITDVIMPMLGGPMLTARITELRPGLKVLYTSGYAENQLATQGVLRDGVNFIQKPYTLAQLAQRVRELLDQPL
jgi:CheY-like chemotaxis protein